MTTETPWCRWPWHRHIACVLSAVLVASMSAGCAFRGARTATPAPAPVASAPAASESTPAASEPAPTPTTGGPHCPAAGTDESRLIDALIAYHRDVRAFAGSERLRHAARHAQGGDTLMLLCRAIVLGEPGMMADLARARTLLDTVLFAEDRDALAVRPLARMLAEDVHERLRLTRTIERLEERLQSSERARAALKSKLDALTEIERKLPARPSPDATLPPPPPDAAPRRNAP